ncbi:MAG TPA: sodium:glutamate symporter [Spirochaetia bacterium]|nr:sodium:glutamate symporter [Spirochaetia bacterium]
MNFSWSLIIDLGILAAGMLAATFIRSRVRFFQRYLIPNALTAGFLLLPFYNWVFPHIGLTTDGLGSLVYHLLSISFIAMTLRKAKWTGKLGDKRLISTTAAVLSQYAIQALVGLGLTILMIVTVYPKLFPAFGFMIPLGFSLGPGQAFAIGQGWESFGFHGAGSVGLTFAAIGFLWACFGGVFLINWGLRKGWTDPDEVSVLRARQVKTGVFRAEDDSHLPVGSRLTTETEAVDTMTFNLAMVFVVYLAAYLLLDLITYFLGFAGKMGHDLAVNLWGLSFIFSALVALLVRYLAKVLRFDHILDNGTLTRISGGSVDLMVSASIAAISVVVVAAYWVPILVMCLVGGFLTLVTVPWICSRLFTDHRFHRTLMIYGAASGTMPTGLALLRVLDPQFETPVAFDFMYSSGLTFALAIPFILIINLPAYWVKYGNPLYFWLAVLVSFGYLVFTGITFLLISRRRGMKDKRKIWLSTGVESDN